MDLSQQVLQADGKFFSSNFKVFLKLLAINEKDSKGQ